MDTSYSRMEQALMSLDRAVGALARQAEGVRGKIETLSAQVATGTPDLFAEPNSEALVTNIVSMPTMTSGQVDLDKLERKLDATIAHIEDLLNDDTMAG